MSSDFSDKFSVFSYCTGCFKSVINLKNSAYYIGIQREHAFGFKFKSGSRHKGRVGCEKFFGAGKSARQKLGIAAHVGNSEAYASALTYAVIARIREKVAGSSQLEVFLSYLISVVTAAHGKSQRILL